MLNALASLAAATLLAAAPAGRAPPAAPSSPPSTPLLVGARVSLAFPGGDLFSGARLGDTIDRGYPLELAAAWKLREELRVGLQGGYLPADVATGWKGTCADQGVTCSAHLWRLAARGEYRLAGEEWSPWGAATLGWEWLTRRWELGSGDWEEKRWGGWTLGAEFGVDNALARRFDIGIFAGFTLGQYRALTVNGETAGYGYSDSVSVRDTAVHYGFTVGLRANFGI